MPSYTDSNEIWKAAVEGTFFWPRDVQWQSSIWDELRLDAKEHRTTHENT